MIGVKTRRNENIEELWKRFKKVVENSGILSDYRKKERYEKPSIKRKRKQAAARKRLLRKKTNESRRKFNKTSGPSWKWNKNHTKKIPQKPYTGPKRVRPKRT